MWTGYPSNGRFPSQISKEPNPSGSRLISYDSVASDFAAVDDNSDFGGKQVEGSSSSSSSGAYSVADTV